MHINGDRLSAAFLASEPEYDEPAWIDAYAMAIGQCMPELTAESAVMKAHLAFAREGDWNNPKLAAGMDALFGPLYVEELPPAIDYTALRGWWWPEFRGRYGEPSPENPQTDP